MEFKKYSHIIWDWNGTLLNDAWLCVEVMNGMLSERNLPGITLDIYREIFDFPVKDYYLKLGFNFDKEPFKKVGMDFMILYNKRQKECSLHSEVTGILKDFQLKGFGQSILSAREENELRREVNDLHVNGFFENVFGLDDHYAHGKTDVGIRLLEKLAIPRDHLLFIGDTLHDAEVAKELGISCILVPNGHQSEERIRECGCPLVHSLRDLRKSL
jgi:phosphoglycolate phosphatase